MFRHCLALLLCLTLALSPALAAPGEEQSGALSQEEAAAPAAQSLLFPKVSSYPGFSDVTHAHWACAYIQLCCESGLMVGQGGGQFLPEASMTNAEIIMLAARIHAAVHGAAFEQSTTPWYQGAVSYLNANGIRTGAPAAYATRQGLFQLLCAVVPESMLTPINAISALPDTSDPAVLRFYNAGILTGVDKYGTFQGAGSLSRAECAAMTARLIDPSLRQRFTPAGQVPAAPFAEDAVVVTVNGAPVLFDQFSQVMRSLIDETMTLYQNYGLVFSWDDSYGMESWPQFFKEATTYSVASELIATQKAAELDCAPEELALTLFGPPSQAELDAYAAEHGIPVLSQEGYDILTDMVLEEKLNDALAQWVAAAELVTTPVYDQLDPKELWELYE